MRASAARSERVTRSHQIAGGDFAVALVDEVQDVADLFRFGVGFGVGVNPAGFVGVPFDDAGGGVDGVAVKVMRGAIVRGGIGQLVNEGDARDVVDQLDQMVLQHRIGLGLGEIEESALGGGQDGAGLGGQGDEFGGGFGVAVGGFQQIKTIE